MEKTQDVSIEKATSTVIKYFEKIYGNLGLLSFRLESVHPNSKEYVWIVECNFLPSMGSDERIYYTVKVDTKNGKILSATQRKTSS